MPFGVAYMPTFDRDLSHVPAIRADLDAITIYDVNHRDGNPVRYKFVSGTNQAGRMKYRVRVKGYDHFPAAGQVDEWWEWAVRVSHLHARNRGYYPFAKQVTIDLPGRHCTASGAGLEAVRYLKFMHGDDWRDHVDDVTPEPLRAIQSFDDNAGISKRKKLLGRVWVHGTPHIVENPESRRGFANEGAAIRAGLHWVRSRVPLFWFAALTRTRPEWAKIRTRDRATIRRERRDHSAVVSLFDMPADELASAA
mgnify:CR=1 FL=1